MLVVNVERLLLVQGGIKIVKPLLTSPPPPTSAFRILHRLPSPLLATPVSPTRLDQSHTPQQELTFKPQKE